MQTQIVETRRAARSGNFPTGVAAVVLAAGTLLAPSVRAQEDDVSVPIATRESHETNALEIAVGLGSANGFGPVVSRGPSLDSQGVGLDVAAGWRINPRWMVGVYSASGLYASSSNSAANTLGTSAGVQVNYHFAVAGKPWIGLGAGWHGYWLSQDSGRTAYQG